MPQRLMMKKLKWISSMKTYNLPRANTIYIYPIHHRELECKNRKSRDTWSNSKFGPGIQNEAGQKLTEICWENTLVIANTLFNNTGDDSTHEHHQIVNTKIRLIMFFAAKDGETLYSLWKYRADCGLDHELFIAKFRLKLKKVGKTTWPFRYDLNQIT